MTETVGTIWKSNQLRSSLISLKNSSILHNKAERYNSRSTSKDNSIKVSCQKNILKLTQKLGRRATNELANNYKSTPVGMNQNFKEKQKSLTAILGNSMKQLKNTEDWIKTKQDFKNLTIQNFLEIILKLKSIVQQIDYIVKHFNEQIALLTKKSINQITIFGRKILESSKKYQIIDIPDLKKNDGLLSLETSLCSSQQLKPNQQFANQFTFHVQNQSDNKRQGQIKFKGSFDNIKKKTIGIYQKSNKNKQRIVDRVRIPKNHLARKPQNKKTYNQNQKSRCFFQLKNCNTLINIFQQNVIPTESRTEIQRMQNRNSHRSISKQMIKMNETISNMRNLIKRDQSK